MVMVDKCLSKCHLALGGLHYCRLVEVGKSQYGLIFAWFPSARVGQIRPVLPLVLIWTCVAQALYALTLTGELISLLSKTKAQVLPWLEGQSLRQLLAHVSNQWNETEWNKSKRTCVLLIGFDWNVFFVRAACIKELWSSHLMRSSFWTEIILVIILGTCKKLVSMTETRSYCRVIQSMADDLVDP